MSRRERLFVWLCAIYFVVQIGVVLWTPPDIQTRPWAARLSDTVAQYIPLIDGMRIYGSPRYPQNRFIFSFAWLTSLVVWVPMFCIYLAWACKPYGPEVRRKPHGVDMPLVAALGMFLVGVMILYMTQLDGGLRSPSPFHGKFSAILMLLYHVIVPVSYMFIALVYITDQIKLVRRHAKPPRKAR